MTRSFLTALFAATVLVPAAAHAQNVDASRAGPRAAAIQERVAAIQNRHAGVMVTASAAVTPHASAAATIVSHAPKAAGRNSRVRRVTPEFAHIRRPPARSHNPPFRTRGRTVTEMIAEIVAPIAAIARGRRRSTRQLPVRIVAARIERPTVTRDRTIAATVRTPGRTIAATAATRVRTIAEIPVEISATNAATSDRVRTPRRAATMTGVTMHAIARDGRSPPVEPRMADQSQL